MGIIIFDSTGSPVSCISFKPTVAMCPVVGFQHSEEQISVRAAAAAAAEKWACTLGHSQCNLLAPDCVQPVPQGHNPNRIFEPSRFTKAKWNIWHYHNHYKFKSSCPFPWKKGSTVQCSLYQNNLAKSCKGNETILLKKCGEWMPSKITLWTIYSDSNALELAYCILILQTKWIGVASTVNNISLKFKI